MFFRPSKKQEKYINGGGGGEGTCTVTSLAASYTKQKCSIKLTSKFRCKAGLAGKEFSPVKPCVHMCKSKEYSRKVNSFKKCVEHHPRYQECGGDLDG